MRPDEALYYLENMGGAVAVHQIYKDMPRHLLQTLAEECRRPSPTERSEAALTKWAQQRLKMPGWEGAKEEKKKAEEPVVALPPLPEAPREAETLVDRAAARPERRTTPARRRAAFLRHLGRCRTVSEAAARTGIDRRTAQRWRDRYPEFDRRWAEIIETRRREALDDVVMGANTEEVRPKFYRGKRVGQEVRHNHQLQLYLLKRADREADRERDLAAMIATRVEEEVARRISVLPQFARHEAPPVPAEIASAANGLRVTDCGMVFAP